MGLYLCIYRDDEEVEGVEVGSYADYGYFIDTVVRVVEKNVRGSRCPTLVLHSDCDGRWEVDDIDSLQRELTTIESVFRNEPAAPFNSDWQREVAKQIGLRPAHLYESFIDVDGEYLIERLSDLARISAESQLPIWFQ